MTSTVENSTQQSQPYSYLLSPDSQRFLVDFVQLPIVDEERLFSYREAYSASLGTMAIHGSGGSPILSRNTRDIILDLMGPDATFEAVHDDHAPRAPFAKFKRAVLEYGEANFKRINRMVTLDELVAVGKAVEGVEIKKRLEVRREIIAHLSQTAVGTFGVSAVPEEAGAIHTVAIPGSSEVVNATNWRQHGECVSNPDIFFETKGIGLKLAKQACARCQSRPWCLDDALVNGRDDDTTRAGFTLLERKQLVRKP